MQRSKQEQAAGPRRLAEYDRSEAKKKATQAREAATQARMDALPSISTILWVLFVILLVASNA